MTDQIAGFQAFRSGPGRHGTRRSRPPDNEALPATASGHPDNIVIARWERHRDVFVTQSAADNTLIDGDITIVTDGITVLTANSAAAIDHALDQVPTRAP